MSKTMAQVLEQAALRPATGTRNPKGVQEAAKLFNAALTGTATSKALLEEAFTTSDFPHLLGDAFQVEARAAYRAVADETAAITTRQGVADFRKRALRDVFGETYFDDVAEGEEYKTDNPFLDTEIEFQVGKTGRVYPITWELFLSGDFSSLADFPGILGRGAANTRNRKVFENLVAEGALNAGFFSETDTAALTLSNLKAAKNHMVTSENYRGDGDVDASTVVLLVPPAMEDQARALTGARTIRETIADGDNQIEVERGNPVAGFQVQVSQEFARLLNGDARHTAWALLPGGSTSNPAVVHGYLNGHPDVDIRVKNDQGTRVGGGDVGFSEGSFDNDTLAYRGRYVIGAAPAFTQGTYASTGQG